MEISSQFCLISMYMMFSVRNKCFLSFHYAISSSWDCVTSILGDWERQHSDSCMERLVKSHIAGLTNYTMVRMAIHETKKVLRREIKKRVAAMTDDAKLKESTSIVSKVSCESSIFRTSRYLRELKQAEKRYPNPSVEHCNFTPDFSSCPIFQTIFQTIFHFPWKLEKSGSRCKL